MAATEDDAQGGSGFDNPLAATVMLERMQKTTAAMEQQLEKKDREVMLCMTCSAEPADHVLISCGHTTCQSCAMHHLQRSEPYRPDIAQIWADPDDCMTLSWLDLQKDIELCGLAIERAADHVGRSLYVLHCC